jgi:hypothetical protein
MTTPTAARKLDTPAARELAGLAAIFDDLQFVLRGCERLLTELERDEPDDLLVEAVWTAVLSSYTRCFREKKDGAKVSVTDFSGTGLQGEVVQWHGLLGKLRDFYVQGGANPREEYSVGVAQAEDGRADGVVITSTPRPPLDPQTVQQTGRLAYQLSTLVNERIKTAQRDVLATSSASSAEDLNALPAISLS